MNWVLVVYLCTTQCAVQYVIPFESKASCEVVSTKKLHSVCVPVVEAEKK